MSNSILIGVCTADLHFGAFSPQEQYQTLKEQFINPLLMYPRLDFIVVAGDFYDHKLMGNSDALYYASLMMADIVALAQTKSSVVIVLHGTFSHDSDQLKTFYHYMQRSDVDVRIVTKVQFEIVKGMKVLCIPELYNYPEEEYQRYLTYSNYYDMALLHGTFEGSGFKPTNDRVFTIDDFKMCEGLMVGGHIHTSGCFSKYFYYTGSPYRWKFGEEAAKGYLTVMYDMMTHEHYVGFNPINCRTYITVDINEIIGNDPKEVIEYINRLKEERGMDYLKIKFNIPITGADKVVISNYYRNNAYTFVEFLNMVEEERYQQQKSGEIPNEINFLLDDRISPLERFVKFVNIKEGSDFITVDKLKEILSETL